MATTTVNGLPQITSPVATDKVSAWDTSAGTAGYITVSGITGTAVTGGGVVATGGYTLTVPATMTAAGRNVANTFTEPQTFQPPTVSDRPVIVNSPTSATVPTLAMQYNADDISAFYAKSNLLEQWVQMFSLADEGIITIGNYIAVVQIIQATNGHYGRYFIRGGVNNVQELDNPSSHFSTTKDTASKINVYYESSSYHIQNKIGGAVNLSILIMRGANIV